VRLLAYRTPRTVHKVSSIVMGSFHSQHWQGPDIVLASQQDELTVGATASIEGQK
jgi:hypothetical protein